MRLGIDLGGTKIEISALSAEGVELLRQRIPTPRSGYQNIVREITELVFAVEHQIGKPCSVGIGIPGTLSRRSGLVKNANSTDLIGHPIHKDLTEALGRPVRIANDANCFTLSEAIDGAATGHGVVFGVILGTGVGGGLSVRGQLIEGPHDIAGEWGHNPLPAPNLEEFQLARGCYCGHKGCIESWCSGSGLSLDFFSRTGARIDAAEIADAANNGNIHAVDTLTCYCDRLARALSTVVNILDPDIIVLGGGLSNIDLLYSELPDRVSSYAFNPEISPLIVKNRHGDSSGVRGAAWLWSLGEMSQGLGK